MIVMTTSNSTRVKPDRNGPRPRARFSAAAIRAMVFFSGRRISGGNAETGRRLRASKRATYVIIVASSPGACQETYPLPGRSSGLGRRVA